MALKSVLLDDLRDMYSAENQLIKALPKLAKGAKNPKLKQLFAAHLEETKGQVERLKQVFAMLEEKPTGQHCNGMEGVIEEGKDALEKEEEGASFDSGLIGAALRTEHYEIAGYEACIAMASTLGLAKVVRLLAADLKEELATAKKITAAGGPILKQSAKEPEAPKKPKSGKEQKSAKKMRRRPIRNCPSKALPSEGYLSIKVGSRFSDVVTAHHLSVEQRAEPFVVKVAEVSRKQRGGTQAAVVRAADPPFRYRLAVEHGLVTDVKTGSGSLQRPSLQHHTAGQLRSTVNLNRAFW